MNFVAQVEEHLRDLATEARKKHPGVKEASERAILQLRSLQTTYVSLVRRASANKQQKQSQQHKHPTTAMFQSQEILRPFLLAANYPDVNYSLLNLVFNAFVILLQGDAICNEDGVYVVRVLSIQANVCCSSFHVVTSSNSASKNMNHHINHQKSADGNSTVGSNASSNGNVSTSTSTISSIGSSIMSGFGMLSGATSSASSSNSAQQIHHGGNDHKHNNHTTIMGITMGKSSGGYSSSTGKTGRTLKEDEALSIRILQLLTMIVDSRTFELTEEVLSQCLAICFAFISATSDGWYGIIHGSGGFGLGMMSGTGEGDGTGSNSKLSTNLEFEKTKQKGNSGGFVGGDSAKKVKRAAIATLRQIISIVFDRAATESKSTSINNTSDEGNSSNVDTNKKVESKKDSTTKSMCVIASRLFLDLCDLAEFGSGINPNEQNVNNLESQLKERGPFSQALIGGGIGHIRMNPPPRSVCFDLLEMIISQQVDLFTKTTLKNIGGSGDKADNDNEKNIDCSENDEGVKSSKPDFSLLLRNRLCPVLSNMLTSEFVSGLDRPDDDNGVNIESNGNRRRRNPDSPQRRMVGDNTASFALLMTLTKLAATIITVFGTHSALASSLDSECHVLVVSLVKYVKAATEVIRDSNEFEDGFVYTHNRKEEIKQSINSNVQSRNSMPYASSHVLWRAAITLELLYGVICDNFDALRPLLESRNGSRPCDTLLSVLIEAVTDFSVVVSSNKVGIVSVVRASMIENEDGEILDKANDTPDESRVPLRNYVFDIKRIQPLITSRARDIVKSQDEWNDADFRRHRTESFPDCDLGAAAWVGFNFVLVTWKSLQRLQRETRDISIFVEGAFASSLALIQHFLRRFPSSKTIFRDALSGYSFLAKTVLPSCEEGDFRRRLILTSLCKLSLPFNNERINSYEILDHHVTALCLLAHIINSNSDHMMNDWYTILCTYESLNQMSISSTQLSSDGSDAVTALATVFSDMGIFTSCMSKDSIKYFIESLTGMTKTSRRLSGFGSSSTINSSSEDQEEYDSFKKKILSYAGQALNMGTGDQTTEASDTGDVVKERNPFFHAFRSNARKRMSKVTTRDDLFPEIPFSLVLIADLAVENCFRFRILNQPISTYLSDLAACSDVEAIRIFSYDVMTYLISQGLGSGKEKQMYQRKLVSGNTGVDNCFKVEINPSNIVEDDLSLYKMPQEDLLTPMCHSITTSSKQVAVEDGLKKLKGILELGLNVSGAWLKIIQSLTSLSGGADDAYIDRSSSDWSLCCTTAFGCLRLIVDDFLDSTDDKTAMIRTALLDCCASFGRSQHDVNISLTATGMLWTIADQDDSPASVDHVLAKLASLASDNRVEVRNCSVNTLFSCIVGCGHRFSKQQWHQCINEIIFGTLATVDTHCNPNGNESSNDDPSTPSRYRVSRHHTRDSIMKQWTTTKVLVLLGIERVFRIHFEQLIETSASSTTNGDSEWFDVAWTKIVDLSYDCSILDGGRETLDLRVAGVDLLSLCCQVSSKVGVVAGDVRVGTNMQVVNGALRSVRVPHKSSSNTNTQDKKIHNPATDSTRNKLFLYAFRILMQFNVFLTGNESMRKTNDSFPSSLDNTVLQVLTKLCQGLSHIYDCSKDDELLSTKTTNEMSFVALVSTVTMMASAPGSKYLTQVQRVCFELLEKMAMNSSLLAYRSLAKLFYCVGENSSGDEALHDEASKLLNKICPKISDNSNANVLNMVFGDFVEQSTKLEAAKMMMISPFIETALVSTKNKQSESFPDLWTNTISFFYALFSTDESNRFSSACSVLLEMLEKLYECLPTLMYDEMGKLLLAIIAESDKVAGKKDSSDEVVQDALRIFQKSFSGLCRFTNLQKIQSTAKDLLERPGSVTGEDRKEGIDIEIARITCEHLSSLSTAHDVVVELFSSLCKLMNSPNSSLRRESAKLMSKVDVRNLMARAKDAEEQLQSNSNLTEINGSLQKEIHRADNAEKDVIELRQINSQLMEEVEQLRAERNKLTHQVAVLSEGSTYM